MNDILTHEAPEVSATSLLSARNKVKNAQAEIKNADPLQRDEWAHIDVNSPPAGAVATIADYMLRRAPRDIGGSIYISDALQLVSMITGRESSVSGQKVNLMTLCIGLSASGKDNGQQVIKEALSCLSSLHLVSDDVTSQKATAKSLIKNDGQAFYLVDEAHKFFDALSSKNAPVYLQQASAQMLSLYTSKLYALRDQEQNEISAMIESMGAQIEKEEAKQKPNTAKIEKLDLEVEKLKQIREKGISSPQFNALFYSTPVNIDGVINARTVESGLIGRTIVLRAPEERGRLTFDPFSSEDNRPQFDEIKELIGQLGAMNPENFTVSEEAAELGRDITEYYESRRNDHFMGAIYARGLELVLKIAALASIRFEQVKGKAFTHAFNKIEAEHVAWAFSLVRLSHGNIKNLLVTNSNQDDDYTYFVSRVEQISAGRWVPMGQLCQRLSKSKKDQKRWHEQDMRRMQTSGGVATPTKVMIENFLSAAAAKGVIEERTSSRGGKEFKSRV